MMNKQAWMVLSGLMLVLSGCVSQSLQQPVAIDRISPEQLAALTPPAQATLPLATIVELAQQGKSDAEIIAQIQATQSRYALSSSEVVYWFQQGVSKPVLDYIQQAQHLAEQNAIADEMNKRERARQEKEAQLKRERDAARLRAMDPYWGYYGMPIGPAPWGYGMRSRFGWGIGFRHYW